MAAGALRTAEQRWELVGGMWLKSPCVVRLETKAQMRQFRWNSQASSTLRDNGSARRRTHRAGFRPLYELACIAVGPDRMYRKVDNQWGSIGTQQQTQQAIKFISGQCPFAAFSSVLLVHKLPADSPSGWIKPLGARPPLPCTSPLVTGPLPPPLPARL